MPMTTSTGLASCVGQSLGNPIAAVQALREVVGRYGTPTFAYDIGRIRSQITKLKSSLPQGVDVLYSLKANASLGLCSFMARCGLGADVASAGELLTALEAGFPSGRIFVSGPDKSPAMLAHLPSAPEAVLSIDSLSELEILSEQSPPHRAVLRLRPDFCSYAACAAGPDSRFGLLMKDLPCCREYMVCKGIKIIGFHVFAGSQVLDCAAVIHHMRGATQQSLHAAQLLGLTPEVVNLGGGFGIPYGPSDQELDLSPIAEELGALGDRMAPARVVLELGRYLVAQSGWYLTRVIALQTHQGRRAVVVDGGAHQRADLCGLGLRTQALPPLVLSGTETRLPNESDLLTATDVLGCLSLPSDVLAESVALPALARGDVLAFPNAGAYGLTASPILFHGHPAPAEVAFEEMALEVIRTRKPVKSLLEDQVCLQPK